MKHLDASGYETLFCEACGYAVPKYKLTKDWEECPACFKKGKHSKLSDRLVVHYPENKVLKPRCGDAGI